jgi:hypothetical protein
MAIVHYGSRARRMNGDLSFYAILNDAAIPERREYEVPFLPLETTEADFEAMIANYGLQNAWDAGVVLSDGEWAERQVIVQGDDLLAESQTKYDSWDTDDTAAKLATIHWVHAQLNKLIRVEIRTTKDKYHVYETG